MTTIERDEPVGVAVTPANVYGPNPDLVAGGIRTSSGTLSVRLSNNESYRPPEGWRIANVNLTGSSTWVDVEKEEADR